MDPFSSAKQDLTPNVGNILLSPPRWTYIGGRDPYPEQPILITCSDGSKIRQLCAKKGNWRKGGLIEVTRWIELALSDLNDPNKTVEIRRWKIVENKWYQVVTDTNGNILTCYVWAVNEDGSTGEVENPSSIIKNKDDPPAPSFDAELMHEIARQRAIENGLIVPPGDFPGFNPDPPLFQH